LEAKKKKTNFENYHQDRGTRSEDVGIDREKYGEGVSKSKLWGSLEKLAMRRKKKYARWKRTGGGGQQKNESSGLKEKKKARQT